MYTYHILRNPVKVALLTLMLCTTCVLAGCATVPLASPDEDALAKRLVAAPDRSLIYLYRNEYSGQQFPCWYPLMSSGRKNRSLLLFPLGCPSGTHTFTSYGEKESTLVITAKAGKTHYVHQEIKAGVWMARSRLYEVDEDEGRKAINTCKLIPSAVHDAIQGTHMAKGGGVQTTTPLTSTTQGSQREESTSTALKRQTSGQEEIPKIVKHQGYTLAYEPVINQLMRAFL